MYIPSHYRKIINLAKTCGEHYKKFEFEEALHHINQVLDIEDEYAGFYHYRSVINKAMGDELASDYDMFHARLIDMIDRRNGIVQTWEFEDMFHLEHRTPLVASGELIETKTGSDNLLQFSIKKPQGEERLPELIYTGKGNALLRRRMDQYVFLDNLDGNIQEALGNYKKIIIAEHEDNNNKNNANEYEVDIRCLKDAIDLESIDVSKGAGYFLFFSLAALVRDQIQKGKKIKDIISREDYGNLLTVLAVEEDYELLEICRKEEISFNEKASWKFKDWGATPLFYITLTNVWKNLDDPKKMLKYLAEHGAEIDIENIYGMTPLFNQLMEDQNPEIKEALLEAGANLDYETRPTTETEYKVYDDIEQIADRLKVLCKRKGWEVYRNLSIGGVLFPLTLIGYNQVIFASQAPQSWEKWTVQDLPYTVTNLIDSAKNVHTAYQRYLKEEENEEKKTKFPGHITIYPCMIYFKKNAPDPEKIKKVLKQKNLFVFSAGLYSGVNIQGYETFWEFIKKFGRQEKIEYDLESLIASAILTVIDSNE